MLAEYKQVELKIASAKIIGYIFKHSIALYFHISIRVFCTIFISFVRNGSLK